MPNVNFILLGAEHFYIPINPWTLFWDGIKLLWNRSCMSAFMIFFRWVQNCVWLRPLILYYIIFLGTTQCVWTMCFSLTGRNRHDSLSCVSTGHCSLILQGSLHPELGSFLKCICWSVLCWVPKEPSDHSLRSCLLFGTQLCKLKLLSSP